MKNMKKYVFLAIIITLLLPAYSFAVPKIAAPKSLQTTAPAAPSDTRAATPLPETHAANSNGLHIYIAQDGSATANGASCSSAHPVSWLNTPANWGDGDNEVGAGDTVHLCGVISQRILILGSGVSGKPITIKFEPGAKFSSEAWDAGYGAIYAKDRKYIIVDGAGGKIECTANGTTLSKKVASPGLVFENCQNCEVKNLIVSNMYQRTPGSSDPNKFGVGIVLVGNSSNSSVHDCTVDNACLGIEMAFTGEKSSNVSIYNNSVSKTATGIVVGSGNKNAMAENIAVYNNKISDNYVWAGTWTINGKIVGNHCDGMHVWAVHTGSSINGLDIYNNEIGANLGTQMTGWIYLEAKSAVTGIISNANVYNNLLTDIETTIGPNGFIVLGGIRGGSVYNNTISSAGKGNGVLLSGSVDIDIKNNIFYKVSSGVVVGPGSQISSSNLNAYYGLSWNQMYYQTKFYTLAKWQSVLGFDKNAVTADPLLSPTRVPASTSPVRGKGENLGGIFVKDKAGVTRPAGGWTLGAYQ